MEALVVAAVLDPEPQLDLQAIHLVAISVVMANQLVPMSVHIVTSVRVVVAHQVLQLLIVMASLGSMVSMVDLIPLQALA